MSTNVLSSKDIKREWHLVNAADKVLGRLATEVALKLMGKNKTNFVPYMDNGDFVVVTNASRVKVTGKKAEQKTYFRHSGFPGGDVAESFQRLLKRRPEEIVRHAIRGMLPKTKLGRRMIKKLYIYAGSEHPFTKQTSGGVK